MDDTPGPESFEVVPALLAREREPVKVATLAQADADAFASPAIDPYMTTSTQLCARLTHVQVVLEYQALPTLHRSRIVCLQQAPQCI